MQIIEEIKVILINLSKKSFLVEKEARIAQMVLCPVEKAKIKVEDLGKTDRGSVALDLQEQNN